MHPYQVVVHVNGIFEVNKDRGGKGNYVKNFKHSNKFNINVRKGYIGDLGSFFGIDKGDRSPCINDIKSTNEIDVE